LPEVSRTLPSNHKTTFG